MIGDLARQDDYDPATGMPYPNAMPQDTGPTVADAYRMGGLAGMDQYRMGQPHGVFGGYDRAMAAAGRARNDPLNNVYLPNASLTEHGIEDPTGGAPLSTQRDVSQELAKTVLPTSPLDIGLTVATGGARIPVKLGALAMGALMEPSEAEAGGGSKIVKALRGGERAAGKVGPEGVQSWRLGVGGPSYLSPEDQALFATRYPQAGVFKEVPKEKPTFPGETYPSKIYSPEEQRLQDARDQVVADMKREGYTPYFDPSKRFDVNYNEYVRLFGQPENTFDLTKKIMKGGPPPLDMNALDEAYRAGAALGQGPFGFYKMGQLEKPFMQEYGKDEGRRQFVNRFTTPMAATTAGMTPQRRLGRAQECHRHRRRASEGCKARAICGRGSGGKRYAEGTGRSRGARCQPRTRPGFGVPRAADDHRCERGDRAHLAPTANPAGRSGAARFCSVATSNLRLGRWRRLGRARGPGSIRRGIAMKGFAAPTHRIEPLDDEGGSLMRVFQAYQLALRHAPLGRALRGVVHAPQGVGDLLFERARVFVIRFVIHNS